MNLQALTKTIRHYLKGESAFLKNTTTVFSGRLIVALLALIITPILTRLYDPAAYGVFALYNSIILNLAILGTLALPLAINTTKKEMLTGLFFNYRDIGLYQKQVARVW